MLLLDAINSTDYLRGRGWIDAQEQIEVTALAGGVSNRVLYVARRDRPGEDFVVKQVRDQLQVAEPWFARRERIFREIDVLCCCQRLLAAPPRQERLRAETPRILAEDRENFVFTMSAAPREHRVWKQDLLAGRFDTQIAEQCGLLLGVLHARSWLDPDVAHRLADRTMFDELRLDPYYRFVARREPQWQPYFDRLVNSVGDQLLSLVHADFSPKNLLVSGDRLMMVDFETGHFGDPAFDLGFFMSHLLLKAVQHAPRGAAMLALASMFWSAYAEQLASTIGPAALQDLEARGVQHLAGCLWARVDGKSPVEYLVDPWRRAAVRQRSQRLFVEGVACWSQAWEMFAHVEETSA